MESDTAPFNAFLLVAIFFCLNLVALVGIVKSLCGRSFFGNIPQRIVHTGVLIVWAVIAMPLYIALLYRHKYKRILEQFESESSRQRWIRSTSVVLYLVMSLVLLIVSAMLHGKMTSH